jgi:hypothetical protein
MSNKSTLLVVPHSPAHNNTNKKTLRPITVHSNVSRPRNNQHYSNIDLALFSPNSFTNKNSSRTSMTNSAAQNPHQIKKFLGKNVPQQFSHNVRRASRGTVAIKLSTRPSALNTASSAMIPVPPAPRPAGRRAFSTNNPRRLKMQGQRHSQSTNDSDSACAEQFFTLGLGSVSRPDHTSRSNSLSNVTRFSSKSSGSHAFPHEGRSTIFKNTPRNTDRYRKLDPALLSARATSSYSPDKIVASNPPNRRNSLSEMKWKKEISENVRHQAKERILQKKTGTIPLTAQNSSNPQSAAAAVHKGRMNSVTAKAWREIQAQARDKVRLRKQQNGTKSTEKGGNKATNSELIEVIHSENWSKIQSKARKEVIRRKTLKQQELAIS